MTWDKMSERERDALVAEKVMEWKNVENSHIETRESFIGIDPKRNKNRERYRVHNYTTDISAAMEVVEKICKQNFSVRLTINSGGCMASIITLVDNKLNTIIGSVDGKDTPDAICQVALKIMGVKI